MASGKGLGVCGGKKMIVNVGNKILLSVVASAQATVLTLPARDHVPRASQVILTDFHPFCC